MKLYSWNVNGLRSVAKKGFFDWVKSEQPDILCLQETKINEETITMELRYIEPYNSFFTDPGKKGYSGLALYSREKPREVIFESGKKEYDHEGRILIAKYDEFTLLNIYFPNGRRDQERVKFKLKFHNYILELLKDLEKEEKKIVICGDFNVAHKEIDLFHPKSNEKSSGFLPSEREWVDRLITAGYIDTFREFNREPLQYTWWDQLSRARDRNIGWRIDYFFINKLLKKNLKNAKIYPLVMGSDHCPISITLEF
jgi:exodeoxyribonuclease-3